MPDPDPSDDIEGQDQAEVFDEENITPDGRDIATSDMQRDVYDMTSAAEDADESLAPEDGFDPDRADEAEIEEVVLADEDLDEPRTFAHEDADLVAEDETSPADFESDTLADDDIEALGYDETGESAAAEEARERRLDEDLEGTFPASDPFSAGRFD